MYWNEVVKGESQMWYRWRGDDVVAIGLVVAADCQHRSVAEIETTGHVPNAKVPTIA
jgi:hypothetical protein